MTTPVFTNNLETTVAVTTTASATTIEVADASVFNALIQDGAGSTNGVHEMATLTDGVNIEIVKVTNAATGTNIITVVREQEGTTGYAFLASAAIESRLTAETIQKGWHGRDVGVNAVSFGANSVDLVTSRSNAACKAAGSNSIAIGSNTQADGTDAVSIGPEAEAVQQSVALGSDAKAYLYGDVSIGASAATNATGTGYNVAVGFAAGVNSPASEGVAIGFGTDVNASGGIAIGEHAQTDALNAIGIGINAYGSAENSIGIGTDIRARISTTHAIAGPSIIKHDNAETDELLHFSGQENILFSQEYDFTLAAADNVVIIVIPTGSTFFVSEVGFIPTNVNTITSNPTIEFGINATTDAIMSAVLTTSQTARKRERYLPITANTNWTTDAENTGATALFTLSVTTAAVATTFLGRVYFKGMLVEDE